MTPGHCRLAVVTRDERLVEYVREETNAAKNIRVLGSVDDLESLINTLVSEVTEDSFLTSSHESGRSSSRKIRNLACITRKTVGQIEGRIWTRTGGDPAMRASIEKMAH